MFEEVVDLKKRASASEKDDIKCLNDISIKDGNAV